MSHLRDIGDASLPLLIVLGVTGYVLTSRPQIGPDAMRGLLAVEQRLAGRGNALTEIVTADPATVQVDRRQSIGWWAPGQQQLVYGLRRAGLSLDLALRVCIAVSWVAGMLAWGMVFRRSLQDPRLMAWVIAAFALLRASHSSAFRYTGGETLLWAAFPVVALVNLSALAGPSSRLVAAAAGFLAGTLVLIKYSGGILALGMAAAWLWAWFRRDIAAARILAWTTGALAALPVAAVAGVLTLIQGPTPATSSWSHSAGTVLAVGIGGALGAISDAPDLLGLATRRLGLGSSDTRLAIILLGLSALFAAWVAVRRREPPSDVGPPSRIERMAFVLAVSVTLMSAVAVLAIQIRGGLISWESRHYQYGAFLLLPFFARSLIASLRGARLRLQALALANLLVFFVVPSVYGGTLVVLRTARVAAQRPIDRDGWLPDGRPAPAVVHEIESLARLQDAVLATPSIPAAIPFARRRLHFVMQSGEWRSERFDGCPSGGVALLLGPGVGEADARVLREAFNDVQSWSRVPLASAPAAQLWLGS